jgi:hypothetical protein
MEKMLFSHDNLLKFTRIGTGFPAAGGRAPLRAPLKINYHHTIFFSLFNHFLPDLPSFDGVRRNAAGRRKKRTPPGGKRRISQNRGAIPFFLLYGSAIIRVKWKFEVGFCFGGRETL